MFRQLFIFITTTFILLFAVYWGKCYMGWNFFDNFSLGRYLPVQFMYNKNADVVYARGPGVIFQESFENPRALSHWGSLWAREPGTVDVGLDAPGKNGNMSLLVTSRSPKEWAYSYLKKVKVAPNDTFFYQGYMKLADAGGPIKAAFSVVLYDKEHKAFDYGYAQEEMVVSTDWIQYAREFTLPPEAAYFRFHMTGSGAGRVWFDDVLLKVTDTFGKCPSP